MGGSSILLTQNVANNIIAYITHDLEGEIPIWCLYDGDRCKQFLELVESFFSRLNELEETSFCKSWHIGLIIFEKSLMNIR